MDLRTAIENAKCRKGKAVGTTKRGAYWLACPPIKIRSEGGDGIGSSSPSISVYLELRHYRSGEVRTTIHRDAWHQNGSYSGGGSSYSFTDLSGCKTVEEVIVALKSDSAYGDYCEDGLTKALSSIGLPVCEPGPDEAVELAHA